MNTLFTNKVFKGRISEEIYRDKRYERKEEEAEIIKRTVEFNNI